jgi:hypothetical protein
MVATTATEAGADAGADAGDDAGADAGADAWLEAGAEAVDVLGAALVAAWLAGADDGAAGDGVLEVPPHAAASTAINVNAVIPDRRFKAQPPHAWVTACVEEGTLQLVRILR